MTIERRNSPNWTDPNAERSPSPVSDLNTKAENVPQNEGVSTAESNPRTFRPKDEKPRISKKEPAGVKKHTPLTYAPFANIDFSKLSINNTEEPKSQPAAIAPEDLVRPSDSEISEVPPTVSDSLSAGDKSTIETIHIDTADNNDHTETEGHFDAEFDAEKDLRARLEKLSIQKPDNKIIGIRDLDKTGTTPFLTLMEDVEREYPPRTAQVKGTRRKKGGNNDDRGNTGRRTEKSGKEPVDKTSSSPTQTETGKKHDATLSISELQVKLDAFKSDAELNAFLQDHGGIDGLKVYSKTDSSEYGDNPEILELLRSTRMRLNAIKQTQTSPSTSQQTQYRVAEKKRLSTKTLLQKEDKWNANSLNSIEDETKYGGAMLHRRKSKGPKSSETQKQQPADTERVLRPTVYPETINVPNESVDISYDQIESFTSLSDLKDYLRTCPAIQDSNGAIQGQYLVEHIEAVEKGRPCPIETITKNYGLRKKVWELIIQETGNAPYSLEYDTPKEHISDAFLIREVDNGSSLPETELAPGIRTREKSDALNPNTAKKAEKRFLSRMKNAFGGFDLSGQYDSTPIKIPAPIRVIGKIAAFPFKFLWHMFSNSK